MNFNFSCILILIFAGVLYSIIWKNAPFETSDTRGYIEVAADLRDGKLDELHDRAPGYPLLLLVTNSLEPSRMLFLTQLSLYLLSVLVFVLFMNGAGIAKRFTLLFMLLSLIPPSVVNTAYMLTETLAAFLIALGAVALFWWFRNGRTPVVIVSGLAFALSALVRPAYQLLFVMLTGMLLLFLVFTRNGRRRIAVAAVSIFLSSCLVLGGYSLYNRQSFDFFGVSPMLGFNLSTKTVRVIERLPDEYKDIRELLIRSRDGELTARGGSHTGVMFIWRTIPDLQRLTGLSKVELSGYMLRLNLLLIREAPLEYAVEVSRSLSTYWLPSSTDLSNFNSRAIQLLWATIHFTVVFLFFAVSVSLLGLWAIMRRLPAEIRNRISDLVEPFRHLFLPFLISISIVVYATLVSTMVEAGLPRYRTPTDLLMFFALTTGMYFVAQVRPVSTVIN
jgi:hypothetical protein